MGLRDQDEPELLSSTESVVIQANMEAGKRFLDYGWGKGRQVTVESALSINGLVITMWDRQSESSNMQRYAFKLELLSVRACCSMSQISVHVYCYDCVQLLLGG
jgi:hypothetical protein